MAEHWEVDQEGSSLVVALPRRDPKTPAHVPVYVEVTTAIWQGSGGVHICGSAAGRRPLLILLALVLRVVLARRRPRSPLLPPVLWVLLLPPVALVAAVARGRRVRPEPHVRDMCVLDAC